MALDELDAAVYRAQQEHDAAKQRERELHAAAEKARQDAAEAATMGEVLLADATDGADIDDEQLLAAGDSARRANAVADIAEAKAAGGVRAREETQVKLIQAEADRLSADYEKSVTAELEIADAIDEAKARLDDLVAAFMTQQTATRAVYMRAAHHNQLELNPLHHHNVVLNGMPPGQQPRARIPLNGAGIHVLRAELFTVQGNSFNIGQRNVVHQLSGRMHQAHGRKVTEAA